MNRPRMSRVASATAVLGVVVGVAVTGVTSADADPAAAQLAQFRTYLAAYLGGDQSRPEDVQALAAHPNAVLADARASCAWLALQPNAPMAVEPTGYYATDSLVWRYVRTAPAAGAAGLSEYGRSFVVSGAWAYLCPSASAGRTAPWHRGDS